MKATQPDAVGAPADASTAGAGRRRRKRRRSELRHRAELALFRIAATGLAVLPRSSGRRTLRGVTRLAFALLPARRRILSANLTAAFPEKTRGEIAAIGQRSLDGFANALADFLETARLTREDLLAHVTVAGEENLRSARARGRGVFLLSAHFGSWEIGALVAGLLGEPISPVARPLDNPLLEEELDSLRRRFGNRPISKRDAAKELLRAMSRNETVAILIDQNVLPREAVFVPFFDRPAATTPSLARIQLKTGAAVVPVFTWPRGEGEYRLEFERPILPEDFGGAEIPRDERVWRATARYMEVTEEAIRKDPAAWLWIHDRWKTKPPEEDARSRREESPEVIEGGASRRGSASAARDQASGRAGSGEPLTGASAGSERARATDE
ncbi:MAG TPA: lysophospholipid acyltransferase family protein [Thermoanaerobaculia bacterium]|nr:lysophospholipid acyltransferase family protein [Thermoanaerobaculia bacterium]